MGNAITRCKEFPLWMNQSQFHRPLTSGLARSATQTLQTTSQVVGGIMPTNQVAEHLNVIEQIRDRNSPFG